jgi:hypothetical protein
VTEHSVRLGENGAHPTPKIVVLEHRGDCVNAFFHRHEPAGVHPSLDGHRAHTQIEELPPGHSVVLAFRELNYVNVPHIYI